VELPVH
jgi:subtilisin family serine protease